MNISNNKLDIELFLLDMDGTIYLDNELFDGSLDFINTLIKKNINYVFLTNNSSSSLENYLNKLNKLGVPAFWVYHNKHLVILATFKPVSKEMYSSLSGFTEKTWSEYGSVMVNIIKEHLEKGEH